MSDAKEQQKLAGSGMIAAFVVLVAWLGLIIWLTTHTSISDAEWARLLAVLASLEAVALTAAGALFGVSVQRQRVQDAKERAEKAEERATDAQNAANENAEKAANGKALATAIKARAGKRSSSDGIERVSARTSEVDDELLELSNKLFPD